MAMAVHVHAFFKTKIPSISNLKPIFQVSSRNAISGNQTPRRPKIKESTPFFVYRARPKPEGIKMKPVADALSARGFLRKTKPYDPPENVNEKFAEICQQLIGTTHYKFEFKDDEKKCQILFACSKEFGYKIPSSILHMMKSIGDVQQFYNTPIDTIVPYEALKNEDLPPNLHVQLNYHRFHPETDTLFGGKTAFPKSSTIVSGLKYKDKYKGFKAGNPWDDI